MGLVKNSTGSTFNRGDFTTTNAFFWSSLDLSAYAGNDAGSTPFYIELIDGAGKKATGYLGAVGTGETYSAINTGDDITFASDTGWWTKGTGWAITGGKAVLSGPNLSIYLFRSLNNDKKLVKWSFDLDALAVGGNLISRISLADNVIVHTTTGAKSGYSIGGASTTHGFYSGVGGTATIDNVIWQIVLDPPSTAVHIVSSLNGTTRNWTSIESGFNLNGIASWNIYQNFLSSAFIIRRRRRGRR